MKRKGICFYSTILTNKVKSILELESHHLATITIVIKSGKNYQWTRKCVGES